MPKKSLLQRLSNQRGFTLLELLVVISIIGILVAMGAAAFSTAQRKSRDARRRADMKAIQDAQEQYFATNTEYTTFSATQPCNATTLSSFIAPFPIDPRNEDPLQYRCTTTGTPPTEYCACARLESGGGNSTSNACAFASGSNDYFCVRQLQ